MAGISFAKLRDGSWGLRAQGVTLSPGDSVTVEKRDGSTTRAVVDRVLWTGDGVTLASLRGPSAGRRAKGGPVCADCGRGGPLVRDLEDGGMKHYDCCDIPP